MNYDDILKKYTDMVISSKNQVLISYYLKESWLSKIQIDMLKQFKDDDLWFQNYHLILYSEELSNDIEESIKKYLLPQNAIKDIQKESYVDFYMKNLQSKNAFILPIEESFKANECFA